MEASGKEVMQWYSVFDRIYMFSFWTLSWVLRDSTYTSTAFSWVNDITSLSDESAIHTAICPEIQEAPNSLGMFISLHGITPGVTVIVTHMTSDLKRKFLAQW